MTANTLQLAPVGPDQIARFAPLIPGLIRATGPVSYDYQFGVDGLLEQVVAASWGAPDTLFCAACNLVALAPSLMAQGKVSYEQFSGLAARAETASYLNAHVPDDVYYLHALSTPPQHRGKGVGRDLLKAAIARAKQAGYRELQLDVLADNPAVGFYQAMGLRILAELRSPELSRDHGFPSEYRMAVTL